ncbi:DNA internalization-related competence protein ComEC/Rec2 [Bacillus xiapuensis]|uniref:DNA internalization-related competence protein ComEC/Rec2 n=1 Tax=Bacillus xiapuensis TaxID=2014075 RepID=UPI000C236664|nr:DNA internalization-related competence protein ComEC/Rec2 [Bacillus xiapuensis]
MRGKIIYLAVFSLAGLLWALPSLASVRLLLSAAVLFLCIRMKGSLRLAACGSAVFFFGVGQIHESNQFSSFTGEEKEWIVSFEETAVIDGDRFNATVTANNGERLQLMHRIAVKEEIKQLQEKLSPGVICRMTGTLERPAESRNRNGFDYRKFLASKHIFWQLKPEKWSLSACSQPDRSIAQTIGQWRLAGMGHIKNTFPVSLQPAAAALLFGDRSLAEEEQTKAYQRLGIIHLLAISGLHVALMTAFLYYVLLRLGMIKEQAQLVLLFFLPLYALIAGGSPPVVRAVLMAAFILLAVKLQRRLTPLDALSLSFLLVLCYDPCLLYQAGFQLSYMVSFSLILSSAAILTFSSTALGKMFTITAVAQLAGLPILMYHFFEVSLYSFIANLFFVPFYSFIVLPFLLVTFLLSFPFPPILFLLKPFSLLFAQVDAAALEVSTWPFAVLRTGRPEPFFLILCTAAAAGAFLIWEKTKSIKPAAWLTMAAIAVLLGARLYAPEGEVSFIDIGQGDAIFIRLPNNQGNYLIDTGGLLPFHKEEWQKRRKSFQIGEDVLLPYFKSRGISRVDKLILTHSDYDHIGAAAELFDEMSIKEIIISPGSESKAVMRRTIRQAALHHIPVRYAAYMESWQEGSSFFQFLSPDDKHYEGNDDSLVLYAYIGGKKWLFTGDAEENSERRMIKQFDADADFIKIGHHGSRSSTTEEWLAETTPQYAIISAGRKNRYGHPHRDVIQRLQQHQIKIYRTDIHGEITYRFRGGKGTFSAHIP